jgi:hypothetical protein
MDSGAELSLAIDGAGNADTRNGEAGLSIFETPFAFFLTAL